MKNKKGEYFMKHIYERKAKSAFASEDVRGLLKLSNELSGGNIRVYNSGNTVASLASAKVILNEGGADKL
jgi:hypothetical protein